MRLNIVRHVGIARHLLSRHLTTARFNIALLILGVTVEGQIFDPIFFDFILTIAALLALL